MAEISSNVKGTLGPISSVVHIKEIPLLKKILWRGILMQPTITSNDGRLPEKSFQCSETSEKLSCFTGNPGKTFFLEVVPTNNQSPK